MSAEVTIAASPEAVWNAWTKPDEITQGFVDHAEGDMNVDPAVRWGFEGFGEPVPVTVIAAEPHRLLAIGGPSPVHEGVTVLQEITLEARGGSIFFTHDPNVAMGKVARDEKGRFTVG